jgi:hypothetical protein
MAVPLRPSSETGRSAIWGENPDELYDGGFLDAQVIEDLECVVRDSSVSERRSSRHTSLNSPY